VITLSAAASTAHGTHVRLLDLPAEARSKVYGNLLVLSLINIIFRKHRRQTGCIRAYNESFFDKSITDKELYVNYDEDGQLSRPTQILQIDILCLNQKTYQEALKSSLLIEFSILRHCYSTVRFSDLSKWSGQS
jgi:hypothetical protein